MYEQGLGVCGYELIRELFIFIKLILYSYLYNERIILLLSPLLVVPTECTDHTEAYGLKLFESTEWPTLRDARIHRNECLLVCAFCVNYKQRRYKYKSFSPINCNLQFYHSKFRMNQIKASW